MCVYVCTNGKWKLGHEFPSFSGVGGCISVIIDYDVLMGTSIANDLLWNAECHSIALISRGSFVTCVSLDVITSNFKIVFRLETSASWYSGQNLNTFILELNSYTEEGILLTNLTKSQAAELRFLWKSCCMIHCDFARQMFWAIRCLKCKDFL